MRTLTSFGRVLRDLIWLTVVAPVRDGRPQTKGWPVGLRPIVYATLTVYAILALAVIFAGPLRSQGTLVATATGTTIPEFGAVLALGSVVLAVALLITAALHLPWWVKVAAVLVTFNVVVVFAIPALRDALMTIPVIGGLLVVIGMLIGRTRASYAWWEFVVIALAMGVCLFMPAVGGGAANVDFDWRGTALEGALQTVLTAALPALFVAGAALAQIAVTASIVGVTASSRELSRWPLLAVTGLLLLWATVTLVQGVRDPENVPEAWVGSAIQLGVIGALVYVLVRVAARPPSWDDLNTDSTRLNYLVALGCVGYLVITPLTAVLHEVARMAGLDWLYAVTDSFAFVTRQDWFASLVRVVVGSVGLAVALRPARRQRPWTAMFLAALTVLALADLARVTGLAWLNDSVPQLAGILLLVLLATAAALGLGRRLDPPAATALACGVLLCLVYPHRAILDDPISAALGFSGIGAVLFGLIWRLLTEADITREGTPRWPVPSRVLLFCASALLGVSSTAFVALSRVSGTSVDISLFTDAGDALLGTPLFLTAVLGCLGIALARRTP